MTVDLHQLPAGSVIAADGVVALRGQFDSLTPWLLTSSQVTYSVGNLLAMSQDWTVLRYGPEIPGPVGTPAEPEVRHYICEHEGLRGHMTTTATTPDGRINALRPPWEPLVSEDGTVWYRVSAEVATEYDRDPDDEDHEPLPSERARKRLRDLDEYLDEL